LTQNSAVLSLKTAHERQEITTNDILHSLSIIMKTRLTYSQRRRVDIIDISNQKIFTAVSNLWNRQSIEWFIISNLMLQALDQ